MNDKVYNTKKGTSFREEGGSIINSNIDEARNILAAAGIDPSYYDTIYVLIRQDEVNDSYQSSYKSNEKQIVEAALQAWTNLGFSVEPTYATNEQFETAYATSDYDIVGMDYQMISTHAVYDLAMFSSAYSYNGSLLKGYTNETFDALLADAFKATDLNERAEILHNAEEALIEDGALIPVVFNANAYVVSSELKNVKTDFWGAQIFTKARLKNYVQYLPSVRNAASVASEDEE